MNLREQSRPHSRAVAKTKLVQELALHPRHVDAGRALTFTRLAFEAEVEHRMKRGIGQSDWSELTRDGQPQSVRPAARRIVLLARGHVRGAHRAGQRLAARA